MEKELAQIQNQTQLHKIRQDLIRVQVAEAIKEKFSSMVDAAFSLRERIKQLTGFDLYSNQVDIVECMMADDVKNLTLTGARASGKTFGVLLGLALYSIQHSNLEVGLTAPTDDQSNRMIKTFISKIMNAPGIKEFVNIPKTTNTHVQFKNGTYWDSFSGNDTGHPEGRHFHLMVMDECQDLSDRVVSNSLRPMLFGKLSKVVKLGVPRLRQNFYRSSLDTSPGSVFLKHDVFSCPQLFEAGTIETGNPEYPYFPVGQLGNCPLRYKKIYFPITPEHPDNDKYWTEGALTEEDWESQYLLEWLTDADLFLDEEEQELLCGEYTFDRPETERYYFGLDLAGGSGDVKSKDPDFTILTIGRIKDGVKQIIDAYEWQGDPMKQVTEILGIIHPIYGKYKCFAGMMDLGHNPIVKQMIADEGVNIRGIQFGATAKTFGIEPNPARLNYKNAMFKFFKLELQNGRIAYPQREFVKNHRILKKHIFEWSILEEHKTNLVNSQIFVPSTVGHDDCPCSAVLCCQAMAEMGFVMGARSTNKKWFKTGIRKGVGTQGSKMPSLVSSLQERGRFSGIYSSDKEGEFTNPWDSLIDNEKDPW